MDWCQCVVLRCGCTLSISWCFLTTLSMRLLKELINNSSNCSNVDGTFLLTKMLAGDCEGWCKPGACGRWGRWDGRTHSSPWHGEMMGNVRAEFVIVCHSLSVFCRNFGVEICTFLQTEARNYATVFWKVSSDMPGLTRFHSVGHLDIFGSKLLPALGRAVYRKNSSNPGTLGSDTWQFESRFI
jgi:hypothetical protein